MATVGHVAASTQNQALSALLFLYREVLGTELPWMDDIRRAKRPERLPVVLSRDEVMRLLGQMNGAHELMAGVLYGAGLRLMECIRLRVQDVDFVRREITVRQGDVGSAALRLEPTYGDADGAQMCTSVVNKGGRGVLSPLVQWGVKET